MTFGISRQATAPPETGSRTVETIAELADQARVLAREVAQVASPALQHSAESLAHALARAADSRFAKAREQQAAEVALAARERLADASERFAGVIRPQPPPKRQHHRIRNVAIGLAVVGAIAALVQSPLRAKLTERLFGPPPDEEPESITLPGADIGAPDDMAAQERRRAAEEGNGVPSTPAGAIDTSAQG